MRHRESRAYIGSSALSLLLLAAAAGVAPRAASAQASGRFADGLTPGDYVRVSFGGVSPIRPEGSLRNWQRGRGVSLSWENWSAGSGDVAVIGFGLEAEYSVLPLDEQQLLADFTVSPIGRPLSATADKASVIQLNVVTRFRVPMPLLMPHVAIALGFLNWRPGEIHYTTASGTATAREQHRSGAAFTVSGGFDKHVASRYAVFADAAYTFAYTTFGSGLAAAGPACLSSDCDLLKNTQLGVVRGGLRVRVGR